MGSAAASIEDSIFCDRCGEAFAPKKPVCVGCGATPARHWLQLTSLMVFVLAAFCNALVCWFLLPRLVSVRNAQVFRGWLWLDERASIYGWAPIIMAILAWDYFIWRRSRRAKQTGHKIKGWITRKVLTFVLVTSVTPLLPWWIPAGQPPDSFVARISRYPGLPSSLAWLTVTLVLILLVWNPATRDSLLGHGRILSLISIATLFVLLAMTLLGWSLTYY
jgi:hypothetical protein